MPGPFSAVCSHDTYVDAQEARLARRVPCCVLLEIVSAARAELSV